MLCKCMCAHVCVQKVFGLQVYVCTMECMVSPLWDKHSVQCPSYTDDAVLPRSLWCFCHMVCVINVDACFVMSPKTSCATYWC